MIDGHDERNRVRQPFYGTPAFAYFAKCCAMVLLWVIEQTKGMGENFVQVHLRLPQKKKKTNEKINKNKEVQMIQRNHWKANTLYIACDNSNNRNITHDVRVIWFLQSKFINNYINQISFK